MIFADYRYGKTDKKQKIPEWILNCLDPQHTSLSVDVVEMSQPYEMTMKSRLDLTALSRLSALAARYVCKSSIRRYICFSIHEVCYHRVIIFVVVVVLVVVVFVILAIIDDLLLTCLSRLRFPLLKKVVWNSFDGRLDFIRLLF